MGGRFMLALVLIASVAGAACEAPGATLTVRVQSGLRAEREVRFLQASLLRGSVPCSTATGSLVEGRALGVGDQGELGRGTLTVASFRALEPGTYTLRIQARRPGVGAVDSGPVLVERCLVTSVTGNRVVRVPLTTDCLHVTCPAPGGSASFDQCLNGRCVDPRCDLDGPATSELCCDRALLGELCESNPSACRTATDCEAVLSCSGPRRCEAGVCVEPDEDLCLADEHCDAEQDRCVSEAPQTDAGAPDGGAMDTGDAPFRDAQPEVDAAEIDAPELDAAALDASPDASAIDAPVPMDAGTDAFVPCTSIPRLLAPENGALTGSLHASMGTDGLRPLFRWTDAPGCASYEIEIDDSCAPDAPCGFASPEVRAIVLAFAGFRPGSPLPVSRVAPVGRRYHWRVRACNGPSCGGWSDERYLEVGRTPRDFNGDGYGDLVVGASGQNGEGAVFVYLGSAVGVPTSPSITLESPTHQIGARFGLSVAAAGDLDADGFADLAVGAPEQDAGATAEGNVYVYLGRASGVPTSPSITLDNPANQANGSFGHSVASAGDVNGDGYTDLVVGAYEQDAGAANEGNAFLFLGTASGVLTSPSFTLDNPDNQANGFFGASVSAAGDLDADGFADVVVGAFRQDARVPDEGRVYVYLGSASGIPVAPSITLPNPAEEGGGLFGLAVGSAGDVNGDDHADLIVGAPFQDADVPDEGSAFLFLGSPTGVSSTPFVTLDDAFDESGASFGWSVAAAGDVDADGFDDVAVGAYLVDAGAIDEGCAFLYLGSASGLSTSAAAVLENPENQAQGYHGYSAACAGDLNGDGYADVVVGAYRQDATAMDEGSAFVYDGSASGSPTSPSTTLRNPAGQAAGWFGLSVGRGR